MKEHKHTWRFQQPFVLIFDFCAMCSGESFSFEHAQQLYFFTDFAQPRVFLHHI